MSEWSFYFPADGETKEDAIPTRKNVRSADDAAREACEFDYSDRDGWERTDAAFDIVVVSPDGLEKPYHAWHEQTVEHRVRRA